jgi:hypothetical protein
LGPWSQEVITVTPLACLTCRMGRHPEVRALGDGRRRLWKRVFALWDGEYYPSAEPWMLTLITLRKHPHTLGILLRAWYRRIRHAPR